MKEKIEKMLKNRQEEIKEEQEFVKNELEKILKFTSKAIENVEDANDMIDCIGGHYKRIAEAQAEIGKLKEECRMLNALLKEG